MLHFPAVYRLNMGRSSCFLPLALSLAAWMTSFPATILYVALFFLLLIQRPLSFLPFIYSSCTSNSCFSRFKLLIFVLFICIFWALLLSFESFPSSFLSLIVYHFRNMGFSFSAISCTNFCYTSMKIIYLTGPYYMFFYLYIHSSLKFYG